MSQSVTPASALTLGVRHLSCGVVHPYSGRLTCPARPHSRPRGAAFGLSSGLRFACIPAAIPRGRTVGLWVRRLSCGDSHCVRGARHLFGGVDHSLCAAPVMPARLNACALLSLSRGDAPGLWPPPIPARVGSVKQKRERVVLRPYLGGLHPQPPSPNPTTQGLRAGSPLFDSKAAFC